ncbi:MAG: phosphoribosylformylglycinamidine synthase subunit PurQ [Chitinophagales bacterium]|nr:phosphoribosylformylglycinamidine synthase subunit PurQ [Bacteroidota bacterium]MCB9043080.1 phosphoribosylformylglycinamidine synthase subunit PurQ [Chitinophagales bacterium]
MKFGIIVFPGSNCDRDMAHVLGNVFKQEVQILWHKDTELNGFGPQDCLVLPGGFSYGDYLRCGAIARFSPIMQAVKDFAQKGGFVWGICNGFQILCEAGLLPGVLLPNTNQQYICKNIFIKAENKRTVLTQFLDDTPIKIPIAHAEGRYFAQADTLAELEANAQVLFRYADENGDVQPEANPNGSLNNIAGICNKEANVFGMMPHPERAAELIMGNTDGAFLFQSLIASNKNLLV